MFLFKSKSEKKLEKITKNIMKAHEIVYNDPKRAELVLAMMDSNNVRVDDIMVAEALAILVAYFVNQSIGGLEIGSTQWEEIMAAVILIEFNTRSGLEDMTAGRANELSKRCNVLFADILKKQAGIT